VEIADVAAACLAVIGLLLVVSGISRRPDLSERLAPYQPRSLAEEAQEWLKNQR
jgi:hypothetical protein